MTTETDTVINTPGHEAVRHTEPLEKVIPEADMNQNQIEMAIVGIDMIYLTDQDRMGMSITRAVMLESSQ